MFTKEVRVAVFLHRRKYNSTLSVDNNMDNHKLCLENGLVKCILVFSRLPEQ